MLIANNTSAIALKPVSKAAMETIPVAMTSEK
jgi:hypothetical protein